MPLVLILSGLVPGLAAAGWALASGAGFLVILGVYMGGGACGMLAMAGLLLRRALRASPAPGQPRAPWGLPTP